MAAIELDPTKTYYVNIQVLDDGGRPCSLIASIIDKSSEKPPPPPTPTCVTRSVDRIYDLTTGIGVILEPFTSDQVVAVKFKSSRDGQNGLSMQLGPIASVFKVPQGMQVVISECVGDFDNIPKNNENEPRRCQKIANANQVSLGFGVSGNVCKLEPDKIYYANIRWKNPITNEKYCGHDSEGGCGIAFNIAYNSGGSQPQPPCEPGTVNQRYDFSLSNLFTNRATITKMPSDQVASVKFRAGLPRADGGFADDIAINIGEVVGEYLSSGMEVAISECPGNFEKIPPGNQARPQNCKISGDSGQISLRARSAPQFPPFACRLERGKDYYINIRYKDPITGQKCSRDSEGGCGSNVNLAYS